MPDFQALITIMTSLNGRLKEIGIAALIFIAFLLVRRLFSKLILKKILKITDKTEAALHDVIILAFEKPLRLFFIVTGIYAALSYLTLLPAHDLFILKVYRTAIIILIAIGLYNLEGEALFAEIEKKSKFKIDKILVPFFSKILKFITVALIISIIAQEWGYDVDGFIAGLGLGGLAFALAAKDTIANIFGGVVIVMDKPFTMGDWIRTPSVEGIVEDVTFRSTKVRTFAQAVLTIPNSALANEPITNWSKMGRRRITFTLGVEYGTPREKLEKCIKEIENMLRNHPDIHPETIFVKFDNFGESSLDIFLYFFTNTTVWEEFLKIKEDVNFKIMEILENEAVNVAFPSRSIYITEPQENTKVVENLKDE